MVVAEVLILLFVTAGALILGYLTAVFSMSVYIDRDAVRELADSLSENERKFLIEAASDPGRFLHASSFYRWVAAFIAAWLAFELYPGVIDQFGFSEEVSFALTLLVILLFEFLILEVFPRRVALRHFDKSLIRYIPALRLALGLSGIFIRLRKRITTRAAREVSEDVKEDILERALHTLADQVGAEGRLVDDRERRMIEKIFEFDQTEAREVMTPRVSVITLKLDTPLLEVRAIARREGHSRYPVVDGQSDNIVGTLYIKDIFISPPPDPTAFKIADYMRKPVFVPNDMRLDRLLALFRSQRVHLAIALDEHGGVDGVVTLEDLLELIVGEIQDEHDAEEPPVIQINDRLYDIDASLPLDDVIEILHLPDESEEFETLAGVIYDLYGSAPTEGVELKWNTAIVRVKRLRGQRIERVEVQLSSNGKA